MTPAYGSALAFRTALEERLRQKALSSGIRLDRMRRGVMFERFLARIEAAEPGSWVLKGAVALEARLGDQARATADVDLGLRSSSTDDPVELLTDRLQAILATDTGDFFDYRLRDIRQMAVASAGDIGRARIAVRLAGKEFGGFQVDIALLPTSSAIPSVSDCLHDSRSRGSSHLRSKSSPFPVTSPRSSPAC